MSQDSTLFDYHTVAMVTTIKHKKWQEKFYYSSNLMHVDLATYGYGYSWYILYNYQNYIKLRM